MTPTLRTTPPRPGDILLGGRVVGERPPHVPDAIMEAAKACAHRGIKTGCGCSICNRDHREVKILIDCTRCVQQSGNFPDSSEQSPNSPV